MRWLIGLVLATLAISAQAQTVTILVHNAPGWQASHTYAPATPPTRVNNGAGWNESGGVYVPGSYLAAYQLTSGSCTSGATQVTTWGTGSSITDGTCTWKYVSDTNYVTEGSAVNDGPAWVSGTLYYVGQHATSAASGTMRTYAAMGGTYPAISCTSTVDPGTLTYPNAYDGRVLGGGATASDTCNWLYDGDIPYRSDYSHLIPHLYNGGNPNLNWDIGSNSYVVQLYNDAIYQALAGGEYKIFLAAPYPAVNECNYVKGEGIGDPPLGLGRAVVTVMSAPGEGVQINHQLSTNQANGVLLYNPNDVSNCYYSGGLEGGRGSPAVTGNFYIQYIGLQMKSDYGTGETFALIVRSSIIEGGGSAEPYAMYQDDGGGFDNDIVISHGTIGVLIKYSDQSFTHMTIVQPPSSYNANSAGFVAQYPSQIPSDSAPSMNDSVIMGFGHAVGSCQGTTIPFGTNNASDLGSTDTSTLIVPYLCYFSPPTLPVQFAAMGGVGSTCGGGNTSSCYNLSFAGTFVNPANDFRLSSGSPLRGGGIAVAPYIANGCGGSCTGRLNANVTVNASTPDIAGTTRPQAGQYDIGAMQYIGGAPTLQGPGRGFFR